MIRLSLLAVLLSATAVSAQNPCEGNGLGGAYLHTTPAIRGGLLHLEFGSPQAPGGLGVLLISDGLASGISPLLGPMCINRMSPIYTGIFVTLDGSGRSTLTLPILNLSAPPLYLMAATVDPQGISTSKSVRLQWQVPDSYDRLSALEARSAHTATPLGVDPADNRQDILIAGGGGTGFYFVLTPNAATERFSPLTRQFTAGPMMASPRVWHSAVRLQDGRVLIAGGTSTGLAATASCELYDPLTRTLLSAAPMITARSHFSLTVLDDGRVLAAGGLADWSPSTAFQVVHSSCEIYNAMTDTWTAGPRMALGRAVHTATKLRDGRVLLAAGATSGVNSSALNRQAPIFTDKCEIFDPSSNALSPAPVLPRGGSVSGGRGFHGASRLANGDVLVSGGAVGFFANIPFAIADCQRFDGLAWHVAEALPVPVANHSQLPIPQTGDALIIGGFTGSLFHGATSAQVCRHDGSQHRSLRGIESRAAMTASALADGTVLVVGGEFFRPSTPRVLASGYAYSSSYIYIAY